MNISHIKLTGIAAILFMFNVQVYGDLNDEICKNKKYLKCVNATPKKCIAAFSQSKTICFKKHPVTLNVESKNDYSIAKKYGECFSSEYIKALNVGSENFESCGIHLEPLFEEQLKKLKEKLRVSKEKFHEQ